MTRDSAAAHPTPSHLEAAARRLGGERLFLAPDGKSLGFVYRDKHGRRCTQYMSAADLYDKLLDTMPHPSLYKQSDGGWTCDSDIAPVVGKFNRYGDGPTKLAAVLACVAACVAAMEGA